MSPETDIVALLRELRDDLGLRRIENGVRTLEVHHALIEALSPPVRAAGIAVGLVAQCVEAGFEAPDLLRRVLSRFPHPCRASLPLVDYLHLRMAEGVWAMSDDDPDAALDHFRFVAAFGEEIDDPELLASASLSCARCLRRSGRYDDAAGYAARGEALARSCGYEPLAAVAQVELGWLAFEKGRFKDAFLTLKNAEEILDSTGDFRSRGNVQSAHGRIARRQGLYGPAIECFHRAIAEYRRGRACDGQVARSLLNLGIANRLMALAIQRTLEMQVTSRRAGPAAAEAAERARAQRLRIRQIRADARTQFEDSITIYARRRDRRGVAAVHIGSGLLSLDARDFQSAAAEGAEAFRLGEQKRDYMLMARARTLQCMVENARIEEQMGDLRQQFEAAGAYALDAVQFAGKTQNRRLLARAHVWRGLTWSRPPHGNPDIAQHCCRQALAVLRFEALESEDAWDDLETLKAAALEVAPLDPALRAWSVGAVGGKTFQQITEEFARIVIPKVWESENRKISRVAHRLSISPKKVRRILHATAASRSGRGDPA